MISEQTFLRRYRYNKTILLIVRFANIFLKHLSACVSLYIFIIMRLLLLNIAILLVVFMHRFVSKEIIKYRSFYVCDRGREKEKDRDRDRQIERQIDRQRERERERERERTRKRKQYHTSAANFLYNYSVSLFIEFLHLNVVSQFYQLLFMLCDAIIFNISQLA